jgi:hypothetical protein
VGPGLNGSRLSQGNIDTRTQEMREFDERQLRGSIVPLPNPELVRLHLGAPLPALRVISDCHP